MGAYQSRCIYYLLWTFFSLLRCLACHIMKWEKLIQLVHSTHEQVVLAYQGWLCYFTLRCFNLLRSAILNWWKARGILFAFQWHAKIKLMSFTKESLQQVKYYTMWKPVLNSLFILPGINLKAQTVTWHKLT